MAVSGSPNFEIPSEMRAFAEKSVAQAKQAFDGFVSAAQQAVSAAENQATAARSGAKEIGELAMRYTERNIATSFDFAQKLLRAKGSDEVLSLHGEYVKEQMAALSEQAKELGQRSVKMAGKTAQN
ncbi:MAG TPA: phasin family protein [Pseudolabrys sp.]|nr:phasin family protein [Pseudolabrys sp.]